MMYVEKCMIYCIKFDRKQILYKIEKKIYMIVLIC